MSNSTKSILTDFMGISAFSGSPAECMHHLIFGISNRNLADTDGLILPLTNAEHNLSPYGTIYQIHDNPAAEKLSKMLGQMAWEKHHIAETRCSEEEARAHFIKRYGRSFV